MHKRAIWTLLAALALVAAPLSVGCGDDDDKSGGTGPTPNQNIPEDVAIDQAEGAAEFANSLLQSVRDLSQIQSADDFSGLGGGFLLFKRAAEPIESTVYTNGRWTHTYMDEIAEGDFSAAIDFAATLQFLTAGLTPQQFPDESTNSMNYGINGDFEFGSSFTDEQTQETTTVSTALDYVAALAVTGFLEGTLDVTGTGTQVINLASTSSEGNFSFLLEMTWDIDVLLPVNGDCPSGSIDIAFGAFTIEVTYNGTSSAAWVVKNDGVTIGSGTEFLSCGPPVGASN